MIFNILLIILHNFLFCELTFSLLVNLDKAKVKVHILEVRDVVHGHEEDDDDDQQHEQHELDGADLVGVVGGGGGCPGVGQGRLRVQGVRRV